MCRWRTKGCTALCLNTAGRGGIFKAGETTNTIQEARKRRTKLFVDDREAFMVALVADIEWAHRYAHKRNLTPVFRLNGTSDLLWENIPVTRDGLQFENVFFAFPFTQFYDYTKAPYAARRHDIPNYHLTFSLAETVKNRIDARIWAQNGHSLSAVFAITKNQPLPAEYFGMPVYNADETDLRFLDPKGIAGLHAKGNRWKRTPNGFVISKF
jgi:hypothetical protein